MPIDRPSHTEALEESVETHTLKEPGVYEIEVRKIGLDEHLFFMRRSRVADRAITSALVRVTRNQAEESLLVGVWHTSDGDAEGWIRLEDSILMQEYIGASMELLTILQARGTKFTGLEDARSLLIAAWDSAEETSTARV